MDGPPCFDTGEDILIGFSKGGKSVVSRQKLEGWLNEYLAVQSVSDSIPNGLQIEGRESVERIVMAVSINLEVIEKALRKRADAIIVHHGLFWKNDRATVSGYRKKRLKTILEHDINLFNYHLPLDFHREIGHNRLLLLALGAEEVEKDVPDRMIGRSGVFHEPVLFKELIDRINRVLDTEARYFQYGKERVSVLYVVSGAGRNEIEEVLDLNVDAFLTGDAKESTKYIAEEGGINYIYAGHYNTEKLGIIELGKKIEREFQVDVSFVDIKNPL
jgi:dinuclear metal center YbgI/SA1388 family protein